MKTRILKRKNGKPVKMLVPETKEDYVELQRLYDAGELQVGDSVKPKTAP